MAPHGNTASSQVALQWFWVAAVTGLDLHVYRELVGLPQSGSHTVFNRNSPGTHLTNFRARFIKYIADVNLQEAMPAGFPKNRGFVPLMQAILFLSTFVDNVCCPRTDLQGNKFCQQFFLAAAPAGANLSKRELQQTAVSKAVLMADGIAAALEGREGFGMAAQFTVLPRKKVQGIMGELGFDTAVTASDKLKCSWQLSKSQQACQKPAHSKPDWLCQLLHPRSSASAGAGPSSAGPSQPGPSARASRASRRQGSSPQTPAAAGSAPRRGAAGASAGAQTTRASKRRRGSRSATTSPARRTRSRC